MKYKKIKKNDNFFSYFDQIPHTARNLFVDYRAVVRVSISASVFEIFAVLWPVSAWYSAKFLRKQSDFRPNQFKIFRFHLNFTH